MSRRILMALICLTLGWASNIIPVAAQPDEKPAKAENVEKSIIRLTQAIPEPKKPANQLSPKERAIQYRLKQPISLNFNAVPLREAIKIIAIQSGIEVVPDLRAVQEAKVIMDFPLSGSCDNVNMKSALNILLKPMRLHWVIEDEVLKITTEDRGGRLYEKSYKVADIIDPLPTVEGNEPRKTLECELKDLILNTIARTSWEDMGGRGVLQYFPAEKKLVVTQDQEVHEEIQLLLATMRKLQNNMVHVEVRFVHASAEASQRLLKEMGQQDAARSVVMDDASVKCFLEAAKTQSIVLAPKMNVCDGQTLAMNCLQKQIVVTEFRTLSEFRAQINDPALDAIGRFLAKKKNTISGWRYEVQPIVSPDRKSVRLSLNFEHFANEEAIERITKAAAVFVVPEQRTLVWHLGATTSGRHLFVLVTPRVIVSEPEAEPVFLGNLPPIPGR